MGATLPMCGRPLVLDMPVIDLAAGLHVPARRERDDAREWRVGGGCSSTHRW